MNLVDADDITIAESDRGSTGQGDISPNASGFATGLNSNPILFLGSDPHPFEQLFPFVATDSKEGGARPNVWTSINYGL